MWFPKIPKTRTKQPSKLKHKDEKEHNYIFLKIILRFPNLKKFLGT
jgi:hypothetical protein